MDTPTDPLEGVDKLFLAQLQELNRSIQSDTYTKAQRAETYDAIRKVATLNDGGIPDSFKDGNPLENPAFIQAIGDKYEYEPYKFSALIAEAKGHLNIPDHPFTREQNQESAFAQQVQRKSTLVSDTKFNYNRFLSGLSRYITENDFPSRIVSTDTVVAYLVDEFPSVRKHLESTGKNVDKFASHQREIARNDAKDYQEATATRERMYEAANSNEATDSATASTGLLNLKFAPLISDTIARYFQGMGTHNITPDPVGLLSHMAYNSPDSSLATILFSSIVKEESADKGKPADKEESPDKEEPKEAAPPKAVRKSGIARLKKRPTRRPGSDEEPDAPGTAR